MTGSGVSAGTSSTCGSYFNPGTRDFPTWLYLDGILMMIKCKTGNGEFKAIMLLIRYLTKISYLCFLLSICSLLISILNVSLDCL